MQTEVECVWSVGAVLGEGPLWSRAESALWFVDIKGQAIHRFHPASGEQQTHAMPARVGFVVPTADGSFIAGLKTGLHRFRPATGELTLLHPVEPHAPNNRLNDAFVDSEGYLWFGSMDDNEEEPSGALYQLTEAGPVARDRGYVITNGPSASPNGSVLYHTDTLARVIYAFDRSAGGELSNKRDFVRLPSSAGHPDGSCVDADGCVWTGLFGGWGLRRYSPDGELLSTLRLPCANVTKAAFGGDDLRTLYITTASVGLSDAQRSEQPLAGGLFRARVPVPGLPQAIVSQGV